MAHDPIQWRCHTRLEKFDAGIADVYAGRYLSSTNSSDRRGAPVKPAEVVEHDGNLLVYGGADVLWLGLRDGLSASTGLANTRFNNANAGIAVGDSTAAAANTQTDIQATTASSNRYTKGMDATYPTHTTGTGASTASKILFKATFSSSQANFAWNEWAIKNRVGQTSALAGRMLNRKVQALGTKTSAATWAFTVTLSLA